MTLAVKIDGDDIEAVRAQAAGIVHATTDLDCEFSPLAAERIEISGGGEMTVKKDAEAAGEFFKIVIEKDGSVD